jgi:hypothetical protein
MRRPPPYRLSLGEHVSAIYPPEYQQSSSQPPPEVRPPRKPRRARKVLLIIGSAFAALIVLIVIIGVATGGGSKNTPAASATSSPKVTATAKVAPAPAPTVTQTVTASAAPVATTAPPAVPAADTIIAKFYGTSSGNTGPFTVPADGNWHLSYEYTNGSLFAGQSENFQVTEFGTDGTIDNSLVNDLAIGSGQPTAVPVYSDSEAGSTVYLQVNTEDANWELVVLTGTS